MANVRVHYVTWTNLMSPGSGFRKQLTEALGSQGTRMGDEKLETEQM